MSGIVDIPVGRVVDRPLEPPALDLPRAPAAGLLWSRVLALALVVAGLFLFDRGLLLLMNYWLLESIGFASIFWTNFWAQAILFGIGFVAFSAAIFVPALAHGLRREYFRLAASASVLVGLLAGYVLAQRFQKYLLLLNGESFGEDDPVWGYDIAFYVFDLPAIRTTIGAVALLALVTLIASALSAYLARSAEPPSTEMSRPAWTLAVMATPLTLAAIGVFGVLLAALDWLRRFDVLVNDRYDPDVDNWDASIHNGAEYLDVTGFFNTVNTYTVEALALLLLTVGISYKLVTLRRALRTPQAADWRRKLRARAIVLVFVPGLVLDFGFRGAVMIRDNTQVTPNEPAIQLPYIKRHIDATNKAYEMDAIETIPFVPYGPGDPKPKLDELLNHPTIQNAPLWPGYVSRFEPMVDPEYVDRILAAPDGDTTIYGPTIETFRQQQKLRPYYDFLDVDTVKYDVDGEPRLFASAVRELPIIDPLPWLAWWGQSSVLFTHGYGLVATPVSGVTSAGEPAYAASGIPVETTVPELDADNQRVYYGEGTAMVAYSNIDRVKEHDFPTEQGRAEYAFPQDVEAGVKLDSMLKRLVIGWKSRQFLDLTFSDLVTGDTRAHYTRPPLPRIDQVAPFLYLDTDPYAVAADGRIKWMVNGMTTTDRYPYSKQSDLGDKADVRSGAHAMRPERDMVPRRPTRLVNYVADSAKVVVDAYTGQIAFYKWKDEPVVNTWSRIYPDLFRSRDEMPESVRSQVQYPVQLMHTQFDDLWPLYHQTDPLDFFSLEDAFDDADEVKGALLQQGRGIAFSIEPYYWIADTGESLPQSTDDKQFALSMVFTPEHAGNLRAITTAYMAGDDYGRLSVLQVPKGSFYIGPEQADAAIDQDAFISQQIALWSRLGLEVIRGHTTPLVIGREVLYVEPIFIRSAQQPIPQLKRVVVVFRGQAFLGETLDDALRSAIEPGPRFEVRPGPELGGEPGFLPGGSGFEGGFREGPRANDRATGNDGQAGG